MSIELIEKLIAEADTNLSLTQDSYLFLRGDRIKSIFVVENGLIELVRHQSDGKQIVLQQCSNRKVVAEASVYSNSYHCDAIAKLPSKLVVVGKAKIKRLLQRDNCFNSMWAAYLAAELQVARQTIEILSRKTVSERLDGWLALHGNKLPTKGHWKSLAAQIGVSSEALYRELAGRRFK